MVTVTISLNIYIPNAFIIVIFIIPGLGLLTSPATRRAGGVGGINTLTLNNVRILIYIIYTLVKMALIIIYIFFTCDTYINLYNLILIFYFSRRKRGRRRKR